MQLVVLGLNHRSAAVEVRGNVSRLKKRGRKRLKSTL